MAIRNLLVVTAVLCICAPRVATAQLFNRPFEFHRSGAGDAVGMSAGYRQAILDKQLLNRRPRNLIRDQAGFLLEVERGPSNQAFVRTQAQSFLPPAGLGFGGGGLGFGFGGFSIGGGGLGFGGGGFAASSPRFLGWSMIGSGGGGAWSGTAGPGSSATGAVIDAWIMELASLGQ